MTAIEFMHEDIKDIFLRLKSITPHLMLISEKQKKLISLIRKHTPNSSKKQRHELEALWYVSKAFNSIVQEIMKGEDSVLVDSIFTNNGQFWSTPNSVEEVSDKLTGVRLETYRMLKELKLEPFFVRIPQKLSRRRAIYEYEMRIKIPGT
jgi:hypothetical protein